MKRRIGFAERLTRAYFTEDDEHLEGWFKAATISKPALASSATFLEAATSGRRSHDNRTKRS